MFDKSIDNIETDRIMRYRVSNDGTLLSYASVIEMWQFNPPFRNFFTALLADSPFSGFRWETPALTTSTIDRPFEFVLINAPGFCARKTDVKTYANHFTDDDANSGIVAIPNLSGDATLVIPSPRGPESAYGHLAAFVRNALESQVDSVWRVLGRQIQIHLGRKPIWVSTAGGGVAWLHIRIDSRPKYYGHKPFKTQDG